MTEPTAQTVAPVPSEAPEPDSGQPIPPDLELPGSQGSGRDTSDESPGNSWPVALGATVVGAFLSILDLTVVNVGLPAMQTQFGASTTDIQWVSTAFALTLGVTIPASGWIGARYGLKRTYIWSVAAFAIASLLCGLAWDLTSLIVFRILQAVPGAIIPTVSLTMIQRIVPKDKIGIGMAVYGVSAVMAPALGPALGGYLVEYYDWRMLFFINLPFAVLAVALGATSLPLFARLSTNEFDVWGFVTVASGLFALLLALSKGTEWGWTGYRILGLLTASALLLGLFVIVELEVEEPLFDPRLFRLWTFTNAQILVAILSSGYFAVLFYVPLFLQESLHITPVNTGLVMLPEGLAMAVSIALGGALYDKIGARWPGIIGFIITLYAAYLMCHITSAVSRSDLAWWTAIRGFGYALAVLPIMTAGLAMIPASAMDGASAFMNLIWRVSGALFVGILNSEATVKGAQFMADHSALIDPADPRIVAMKNQGPEGLLPVYQQMEVNVQAQVTSHLFLIMAVATAVGLLLSLTLRSGRPTDERSDSPREIAV